MSGFSVGTLAGGLDHPSPDQLVSSYREEFVSAPGQLLGEFSPSYLRCLWVPPLARMACPSGVVIVALLRDPVERFFSSLRLMERVRRERERRGQPNRPPALERAEATAAQWTGMYALQLEAWAHHFPERDIHVLQYERVAGDPSAAIHEVWASLGLEPVPLSDVDVPSQTSAGDGDGTESPALRRHLRQIYRPQLSTLARRWGIDADLWTSLTA